MALLMTSRDLEQAVDRPITDAQGHKEDAFSGSARGFRLTHMGYANSAITQTHSIMQRSAYDWHESGFWRKTWSAVDQAPGSTAHERLLIANVVDARFEYLDESGHFQTDWPSRTQQAAALPRAVRLTLTLAKGGTITQMVVIPAGSVKHAS
jgi:general secretion pathway protein J